MHLRLFKKNPSHEEVFLEQYSSMLTWARNLTKNDVDLAEDLVQDAFIQFTLTAPNLDEIQNLNGYLYGLLRNLCLSHFRRETKNRLEQLSVFEYDSAEDGLNTVEVRDQEIARDDLQKICSFLTIRKNSARTAGIFILRFFHGYFPSEIAQILRTSRPAIDVRLMNARKEIRAFLDNPQDVKFIGVDDSMKQIFQALPIQAAIKQDEFLNELRKVIFEFREGEHQSKKDLKEFYEKETASQIEVERLSHLVSCPQCLEEVNSMLKLPKLGSRFPTDAIGRDKKNKNNDSDDSNSGGAGGGDGLLKLQRRAQRVFEHKPNELRVVVNGVLQGSLKANAEFNELKLNLLNAEPVGFIEVFSEQQVRLLMLNVEELPPVGASDQSVSLNLSDNRRLDLQLNFVAQGAEVGLFYHDPTYQKVLELSAHPALLDDEIQKPVLPNFKPGKTAEISFWNRWLKTIRGFNFAPRLAASLAILLIAAIFFVRSPFQTVSASELLERSKLAQYYLGGKVVNRKITVKATSLSPNKPDVVRHFDEWVNPQDKTRLRRLYNDNGQVNLIVKFSENEINSYAPKTTKVSPLTASFPAQLTKISKAWENGLTPEEFQNLIGDTEKATVEEQKNLYLIHYKDNDGTMKATLVLDKESLRPVRQNLEYQFNGKTYTYDFSETAFDVYEPNAVDTKVFEIDPGFIEKNKTAE